MAYFKIETEVTVEPITLAEVKTHLHIYDDGFNDTQAETITTRSAGVSVVTGDAIDVLGCRATVWVNVGVIEAGGLLDVVIYECDTIGGIYTPWADGTFAQIAAIGQSSKEYTGGKRYIKAVATITVNTITFGVNVQMLAGDPVSDSDLLNLITRAREEAEEITRLALAPQTIEIGLDAFPNAPYINLKRPPLTSVTSFDVYDSAGTKYTQAVTTDYLVDTDSVPGRVVLPYSGVWANYADYPINPIRIKYVAGYTTLPARLKTALLLHVGLLNRYRDIPIPKQERELLERLYNSYRVSFFGGEQG